MTQPRFFAVSPGAALLLGILPLRAAEKEVLPFNAAWEWLMVMAPDGSQLDPVLVDADFLETWTMPLYDGPAFQPGTAPFCYGTVDLFETGAIPPVTRLPAPVPSVSGGTVYFRTTLDLAAELTNMRLEFLVDDGFILYIDGVPLCSRNMHDGAGSSFRELTRIAVTPPQESVVHSLTTDEHGLPLRSLLPGRHTIHLSLHSQVPVNSDMGFMLRILGEVPAVLTSGPAPPSSDGSPRLLLTARHLDPAIAYTVETSTDLTTWAPAGFFPPAEARSQAALDVPAVAGRRFFRLAW